MKPAILPIAAPRHLTSAEAAAWALLRPRLDPESAARVRVREQFPLLVEEVALAGECVSRARAAAVACGLANALPGALRAATRAAATPSNDDFDDEADFEGDRETPAATATEPAAPAAVPEKELPQ